MQPENSMGVMQFAYIIPRREKLVRRGAREVAHGWHDYSFLRMLALTNKAFRGLEYLPQTSDHDSSSLCSFPSGTRIVRRERNNMHGS